MARLKFGAIVTDIRGKVGGMVFQANRYGSTLRVIPRGVNQRTEYQQVNRGNFQEITRNWSTLTPLAKAAWNAAVGDFLFTTVFGDQVAPSGQLLYTRLNVVRKLISQQLLALPPVNVPVTAITSGSGSMDLGLQSIGVDFTPTPVPANMNYMLYMTKPLSSGISNFNSYFRLFSVVLTGTNQFISQVPVYVKRFGSEPLDGQTIKCRIIPVAVSSGVQGVPFDFTMTIAF